MSYMSLKTFLSHSSSPFFPFLPPAVAVLQTALVSAGQCDSVFKGFSDCLIQLGDNMANYPQDLDDRENLHKICK